MTVANDVSKLVTSTGGQISKRDVPSAVQSYASSSPPPFCLSVCLSVCMSLSVSMLFFFCFFLLLPRDSHCLLRVFSFVSFSFSSMFPKKCSCIIHLSSQRRFSPPSPAPAPSSSSSLMFISCLPFQKRRNLTTQGTGEKTCSCSELRRVQKKVAESTASQPFV